jgi:hypothetical protein
MRQVWSEGPGPGQGTCACITDERFGFRTEENLPHLKVWGGPHEPEDGKVVLRHSGVYSEVEGRTARQRSDTLGPDGLDPRRPEQDHLRPRPSGPIQRGFVIAVGTDDWRDDAGTKHSKWIGKANQSRYADEQTDQRDAE